MRYRDQFPPVLVTHPLSLDSAIKCNYIKYVGNEYTYEWDEAKRLSNFAKHGVDFASVAEIDWKRSLFHFQMINGEERVLAYAPIGDRLHAIVFVEKIDAIRIISLRKANQREVKRYVEEI